MPAGEMALYSASMALPLESDPELQISNFKFWASCLLMDQGPMELAMGETSITWGNL
jgi:hypothetical protein